MRQMVVFLAVALAGCAVAPEPETGEEIVGSAFGWDVVQADRMCWAVAPPKAGQRAPLDARAANFFIANRPEKNIRQKIYISAGFNVAPDSEMYIDLGRRRHPLEASSEGELMWLARPSEEAELIGFLVRSFQFDVVVEDPRYRTQRMTYSANGLRQALKMLETACP